MKIRSCLLKNILLSIALAGYLGASVAHAQSEPDIEPSDAEGAGAVDVWRPLSVASDFNAFMLESFEAPSSDIQGALAAGGDINLNSYSIASELITEPEVLTLISGGDIYFENGRLYTGSIAAAGSVAGVKPPVIYGLQDGAQALGEQELPFNFADVFSVLESYSLQLSELPPTGTVEYKWGGAYLTGDCESSTQVFSLDGESIYNSHTFAVDCVPADATIIFNLSGYEPGFTNVSLYHLNSNAHNIIYNFFEAEIVNFSNIAVEGSVLAPKAHFNTSWGHVNGTVIGKSWTGPMELHHVPFTGNLSFLQPPPKFISEPILQVMEGETYEYPVLLENTYGQSQLTLLGEPPVGLYLDSESNTVLWQTNYDSAGLHEVTLSVAGWEAVTQTFTIEVINVNRAPIVEVIQSVVSNEADLVSVQVSASDPDNDPLTYSLSEHSPAGMAIDGNGLITWQTSYADAGSYDLLIYVSDGVAEVERNFTLSVSNTNRAPIFTTTPVVSAQSTIPYAYAVNAEDPDGDAITFSLSEKPQAMSLSADGILHWTPTLNDVGPQRVTVVASDGELSAEQSFEIDVITINLPPAFTSAPILTALENTPYTYTLQAQDPNLEDSLSFELEQAPPQMVLIGNQLQWTPNFDDAGLHDIQVIVSDGELTDRQIYQLNVANTNRRPEFNSVPITSVQATFDYQYTLDVTDPDGDAVSLKLTTYPEGMSLTEGGVIVWSPTLDNVGEVEVRVEASDGELTAAQTYVIDVASTNLPPVFTSTPVLTAQEASAYHYPLSAEDPNEDAVLTFQLVTGPPGMSLIDDAVSWTPAYDQAGLQQVIVSVSDGELQAQQTFTISVGDTEQPVAPTITSTPVVAAFTESVYTYAVEAVDTNTDDSLTYSLTQYQGEMSIDADTGVIVWTVGDIAEASYGVTVVVTDSTGLTDTQSFEIAVTRANQPPVITSTPIESINSDEVYFYDVNATDPDGDTLSYYLIVPPAGMTIDEVTGVIEWQAAEPGFYSVTVEVFDGNGGSASQFYMVSVIYVNRAPDIVSEPVTEAQVGVLYQYSVVATDPENDTLIYELVSHPEGMTIDESTGQINWVPSADQAHLQNVHVRVFDPDGEFDEQYIELSVEEENNPPVITSIPVNEVYEGESYIYAVAATDPDGDELTYSLEQAPSGMSIDPQTGLIAWVGSHEWANSTLEPNQYCELPASDRTVVPEAMDAVMLMDGSGSNAPFWPMVSDALAQLNAEVKLVGVGAGEAPNLFGVSGFDRPHTFANGSLMSSVSEAFNRTWRGRDVVGSEYANSALEDTIRAYPFRADVPSNIIWVADEPAQGHPYSASNMANNPDVLIQHQQEVQASGVSVHAITITQLACTNQDTFMGLSAGGHVYSLSPEGRLSTCELDVTLEEKFDPSVSSNYVYNKSFLETALLSGGSIWDWQFMNDGTDDDRAMLFKALVQEMYEGVTQKSGPYEQFDLVAESAFVLNDMSTSLHVTVANRGLAASPEEVELRLTSIADGSTLATQSLVGALPVSGAQVIELPVPEGSLPELVKVEIVHSSDNECEIENNQLIIPLAKVVVSDQHNAVDTQVVSVVSQNLNEPPVISVSEQYSFAVNQVTEISVGIADPDIGDSHFVEVDLELPFELDPLTGTLRVMPSPESQGIWPLTIKVQDLAGEVASYTSTIEVSGEYLAPSLSLDPAELLWARVVPGRQNAIALNVTLDDSADATYTLLEAPPGVVFDEAALSISWDLSDLSTPDYEYAHLVTLAVTDQYGHTEYVSFGVLFDTENVAPLITSIPPMISFDEHSIQYSFEAEDENLNDLLAWDIFSSFSQVNMTLNGEFSRGGSLFATDVPLDVNDYEAGKPLHADYLPSTPNTPTLAAKQSTLNKNSEPRSYGQYLVGPMRDDNGNGTLDSDDDVLLVYQTISNGSLAAYDLHTRSLSWAYDGPKPKSSYVAPAMADLDGTGQSTVVYLDNEYRLTAVDAYGQFKWRSSASVAAHTYNYSGLVLGDLESDGETEILFGDAVFNSDGTLKWRFLPSLNLFDKAEAGTPHAVDLDGDGILEVAYLDQVRRADGSLLWFIPGLEGLTVQDSHITSADVTGNGVPELIVLSKYGHSNSVLNIVNAQGDLLKAFTSDRGPKNFGPLVVENFLGDGGVYIFSASDLSLYDLEGELVWENTEFDGSENRRSVIADFDQNGSYEILMTSARHKDLVILSARTGGAVSALSVDSAHDGVSWGFVDALGDGVGKIYPGEGVQMVEVTAAYGTPWRSEWPSFNHIDQRHAEFGLDQRWQYSTSQANVHALTEVSADIHQLADLHISYPRGESRLMDGLIDLSVTITNVSQGSLPAGAKVTIYRDSVAPDTELSSRSLSGFAPFEQRDLIFSGLAFAELGEKVVAIVEPVDAAEEVERNNNSATGYTAELVATDMSGEVASQIFTYGLADVGTSLNVRLSLPGSVVVGEKVSTELEVLFDSKDQVVYAYLEDAPRGMTLDPVTHLLEWTPKADQVGRQNVSVGLYWNDSDRIRSAQGWTTVVEPASNGAPIIVSDPPKSTSQTGVLGYRVQAEDPDGDVVTYKLIDGPSSAHIHPRTGYLQWGASASTPDVVSFTVLAEDAYGAGVEHSFPVSIPVVAQNNAPQVISTPGFQAAVDQPYRYTVYALDPDGEGVTVSLESDIEGMSLDGDTVNWTPNETQQGEQTFAVIIEDTRGGSVTQTVRVYVNNPAENQAPVINSMPATEVTLGSEWNYVIAANDSDGDALSYQMQTAAGQANLSGNAITFNPGATGSYHFLVQVTDGRGGLASQSFELTVAEPISGNRTPEWTTVPALNAKQGYTYRYDFAANDPDGDLLSYSVIDAPDDAEHGEQYVSWTPQTTDSGQFRVLVDDGIEYSEQIWTVVVAQEHVPLTLSLNVSSEYVDQGDSVFVQLVSTGGVGALQGSLMLDGTAIALGADLSATVPASTLGLRQLSASISDGVSTALSTGEFFVRDPNADSQAPLVQFSLPDINAVVTQPTDVIGLVEADDLASWALYYREKGAEDLILLNSGQENVANARLGNFDPTLLMNGQYQLVLRAWNSQGVDSVVTNTVTVEGEMKIGHFSVSFEDANLPLTGIPIRVTRTYDSRRAHEALDFGYGWSIDYQNVRVHSSRTVGLGWQFGHEGSGLATKFCVKPLGNPIVSVTLPNGDVEKFKAKASPECTRFIATVDVNLVMEPMEGTQSTLRQTDYGLLRAIGGNLVDIGDLANPVDPQNFVLTTQDGMEYHLNKSEGIEQVKDLNGNHLTFSDEGIKHSSGEEIVFNRDEQGRIRSIELPNEKSILYDYSVAGDLTAVTNTEVETTGFSYLNRHHPHYLTDITDARGIVVARNEYDDDGRLVARIDADGNRIEFERDIEGRSETIRNRLGYPTTYVYNERGDITAETDALNNTTYRTYDEFGNMLTERNALNKTKSWVYDARGQTTSETNELGETTYYAYNLFGEVTRIEEHDGSIALSAAYFETTNQLRSITDGAGNTTNFAYNSGGELALVFDANNNRTRYVYNARGMSYEEEDDGTIKVYGLDPMGNRLRETETVVLDDGTTQEFTTSHEYDSENRLVKTIDPFNEESSIEYNETGLVTARVDKLERRTEYVYDKRGLLIETRFHDETQERTEYDAEGQKVSFEDRLGRITRYEYDKVGRLEKTIYPDLTEEDASDNPFTRTTYDKVGRVAMQFNELNSRIASHTYDDAGRLTRLLDSHSQLTEFTYNVKGWRTSTKLPLRQVTQFEHDGAGRVTTTHYPDLSKDQVTYDPMGRVHTKTDQAGKTTEYEYNIDGMLTAVIDHVGNRTEYTYDSRGLKLSQKDAEGRVTLWRYDALGREVSRTLPELQEETFGYDAVGNRIWHKDFNGNTHEFFYDLNDRLIRAEYADGNVLHFTYDAVGNRLSATVEDPLGVLSTTTYTYDARDRLLTESLPSGNLLHYEYDLAGNVTKVTVVDSEGNERVTEYAYDYGVRLRTVTSSAGITRYSYDQNGNLTFVRPSNRTSTEYIYNDLNRLTNIEVRHNTGGIIAAYDYTLDPTGRRTAIEELGGITHSYDYDDLYRLVSETQTAADESVLHSASYIYDKVGNRTEQTVNGVTTGFDYNRNDWLLQAGGVHYTYDDNGNTLTETEDGAITSRYTYNSLDQMVESLQAGVNTTYGYNADGIRTRKSVSGISTFFTIDSNRDYAQVVLEESANDKRYYHYGLDLISQYTEQYGDQFYIYDGLGSTRMLTDRLGDETATYRYDAWGEMLDGTGDVENTYLFTGEQYDSGLGQYYLRARYYDQNVGRFTQMDTWIGICRTPITLNKYIYANSDAVNGIDPSGKNTISMQMSALNGLGALSSIALPSYTKFVVGSSAAILYGAYVARDNGIVWAMDESADQPSPRSLTREERRAKSQERKQYKSRCTQPPPPGLSGCELLKWLLERNKDCMEMRQKFGDRWYGDNDPNHVSEISRMAQAVRKLEEEIRRKCGG